MKPIVQFISQTSFFKNISVVQFVLYKVRHNFRDKQHLVEFIEDIDYPEIADTMMYVKCNCKREYIYVAKDDIPESETDCACGQKLIIYGRDS